MYDQVGFIPEIQGWFNIKKLINAINYIYRIKGDIINLIQKKKAFGKILHIFMIEKKSLVLMDRKDFP